LVEEFFSLTEVEQPVLKTRLELIVRNAPSR
jgi:hypothetical protein